MLGCGSAGKFFKHARNMLGCGSAGKFLSLLIFIITCESVGTVDSMCFPWQHQVNRANEALKQLGFAFLSYLKQGARSLSVFLRLRQIFCW